MKKVVHIIPHFGGGAGVVITALIESLMKCSDFVHSVYCFEYLNEFGKNWAERTGIEVYSEISPDDIAFHGVVESADIVHVHFWNHPALYYFLYCFSGRTARMAFWSHTNGHHAPYLFNDVILNYPTLFVLASDYSLETDEIVRKGDDWIRKHIRTVFSCSGTKNLETATPLDHNGFNIGYIGTVDYCKMHRDFVDICDSIDIPDLKVIVCGGPGEKDLFAETVAKGVADKFDIRGHVSDVHSVLEELDLFIYPLNNTNYGTGEQVLIEAMSAGIPQIVLDNGPESFVIKDGVTGIVARDTQQFTEAVEYLWGEPEVLKKMSSESRKFALENYSISQTADSWMHIYMELLDTPKKAALFPDSSENDIPLFLFFVALGESPVSQLFKKLLNYDDAALPKSLADSIRTLEPIHFSETRGSARHYLKFFKSHNSGLNCIERYLKLYEPQIKNH